MSLSLFQNHMAHAHEVHLLTCAALLASPSMQRNLQRLSRGNDADRIEGVGALVDALIPTTTDVNGLLDSMHAGMRRSWQTNRKITTRTTAIPLLPFCMRPSIVAPQH